MNWAGCAGMSDNVPDNRRPLKTRSQMWARSLASAVAARGFTPNQISLAGIGVALIGFVFLYCAGRPWPAAWIFLFPAAVCVQLRLLCNMLDGMVAVEGGKREKGGELFNEVPDRVEDTLLFVGAGYAGGSPDLGWLCAVLGFLLTIALLIAPFFQFFLIHFKMIAWMLGLIAAGTAITGALRLRRIYAKMP